MMFQIATNVFLLSYLFLPSTLIAQDEDEQRTFSESTLASLQGEWKYKDVQYNGASFYNMWGDRRIFILNEMLYTIEDFHTRVYRLKITGSKRPIDIELCADSDDRKCLKGILQIKGKVLKLCWGSGPRPTAFETKLGNKRFLEVCRRVPKRDAVAADPVKELGKVHGKLSKSPEGIPISANFHTNRITDIELAYLVQIPTLESVMISSFGNDSRALVTDDGVKHILTLGKLKKLVLKDCFITDNSLFAIRQCRDLNCWGLEVAVSLTPGLPILLN